jgi:hypothetical protein
MTKNKTNSEPLDSQAEHYHKLSIQVSLNGLSFCILDTIGKQLTLSHRVAFVSEVSPYDLHKELKEAFREKGVGDYNFSEVIAIHRNSLFSLVPQAFFDPEHLANYLKFNAKIYPTDHLDFDWVEGLESANVYVPFTNVNNYIYDLFGEFEFKHSATVLLETLLKLPSSGQGTICYVHLAEEQMDMALLDNRKLLFFNSFPCTSPTDFMYYLLFSLEQLGLDTDHVKLRLLGDTEEGDPVFEMASDYLENVSVFVPDSHPIAEGEPYESLDFTLINAL